MPGRIAVDDDEQIIADLLKAHRRTRSVLATQMPQPRDESFTVASNGETDFQLAALPIEGSVHVSCRVPLVEGDTFTVDYDTGLVTLSYDTFATPAPADIVDVHYLTTGELVAAILPPEMGDYVEAVLADSPLVYYRMNGTGATETDLSPDGRAGTMTGRYLRSRPALLPTDGAVTTDMGNSSQGSTNPGSGAGYVVCPYDAGLITSDWSFELWTNKGSSSATAVLQWTGRLRLELGNTWNVRFFSDPTTHVLVGSSDTAFLNGSDYAGGSKHLVVTFDSATDTLTFYRDGTQFGSTVTGVTAALLSTTNDLLMGYVDGADGLCDGAEFAFYGTVLSSARVAAHYAAA